MKKKSSARQKLDHGFLTKKEVNLLKKQVRFNSECIGRYIQVIDLLINKEKCPKDANTLIALRKRLNIMIEESDTFRNVLWRHQKCVANYDDEGLDAISFLASQIKSRKQAWIAQLSMK